MSDKKTKKQGNAPAKTETSVDAAQQNETAAVQPQTEAQDAPAHAKSKKRKAKKYLNIDTEEIKKQLRAVSPARWVLLVILLTVTVFGYIFYGALFSEDSWFKNPNTGVLFFDNVLNKVPAFVRCVQYVTILLLISTIVVVVIRKSFGKKNARELTISSLICNLINWITAIIMIIVILSAFGVDTTALITGAGVLTLIVGLGMQSLIADIVAGLFIVFENEFNVGDWVTVGDFRGEVVSIGIRTTKLKAVGNVKIINNSDLRGVINHDTDVSVAKTLIDVEYDARLPDVEKIIKKNVAKLKVPHATDAVSYDGVASLGASGVTLQFTCHCKEADIFTAGRELNFAVKNMFDENGIDIPFPQVVVHKG